MPGCRAEEGNPPISANEQRWRGYIRDIAGGDSQALARMYDECAAMLLALARRMMRNDADAEEIILDVFDQVWRTASSFDPNRGSAWRWLTLLVRSRAVERLRTAASKRDRERPSVARDCDLISPDPLPDRTTAFIQERTLINFALQSLPEEQRQAVTLAYFSGLTHVEVASSLNLPLGTVKTRIRAAMEKLRILLAPVGSEITESLR